MNRYMSENTITRDDIEKLYRETELIFPEDKVTITRDLSGNIRVFKEDAFRIGIWCVIRSEDNMSRLNVGYWNSYSNQVEVTRYNLTLREAKDWLIDKARTEIEIARENEIKIKRQRIATFKWGAFIFLVLSIYIYAKLA